MEARKLVMKCCICGRVKTDHGWEYDFQADEDDCSHGFCAVCYETEIRKIKFQTVFPQMVLYR